MFQSTYSDDCLVKRQTLNYVDQWVSFRDLRLSYLLKAILGDVYLFKVNIRKLEQMQHYFAVLEATIYKGSLN